jgi:hypothetical protein
MAWADISYSSEKISTERNWQNFLSPRMSFLQCSDEQSAFVSFCFAHITAGAISDNSANCRNCKYEQTRRKIFYEQLKRNRDVDGVTRQPQAVFIVFNTKERGIINKSIVWLSIVRDVLVAMIQTIRFRRKANLYWDIMMTAILWDMTRCCLVTFHWSLRMYYLHLQGLSLSASRLPSLLFDPEDGGITFVQNIDKLQGDYMASHPTRRWKPQSLLH